jgi:ABC-type branched-subunit amino acid transport system substrate-binding protein
MIENRSKLGFLVLAVAIAVVSLALLTAAPSGSAADQKKMLRIGSILPFNQKEGLELQKWMKLFAKMYNEQGGWLIGGQRYQVEYTAYDGGFRDAQKARSAVERAVLQDGLKILVSNWGDPETQTITITEPNKVLTLGAGFNDAAVAPNIDYYIRSSGVYFTRGTTYIIQKDYMARGAKTDVIVNPDTEAGRFGAQLWASTAKLAGLKVLDNLFFNSATLDFGAIATTIKSLNPDMVDTAFTTGNQITNLIAALKDAGYKGLIYPGNMTPFVFDACLARVGKEYLEGTESLYFDPRGIQKDPKMLELVNRYIKEYGEFQIEGCGWLFSWFPFKDAVESTGSVDPEVIRKYLQNSKRGVMSLVGYVQLFARPDKGNFKTIDAAPTTPIAIVRNGKLTGLKVASVKDQYLVSIKSYNTVDAYQKYWDTYGYPKFPDEPSIFDYSDLKK